MMQTLRHMAWMMAWIQVPPLLLTSGTDKAKLLSFMRPQFYLLRIWQSLCLLGTYGISSESVGRVIICSDGDRN